MKSVLVCLDGNSKLGESIITTINSFNIKKKVKLDTINSQKFSDNEICPDFVNSIRGKRVFLLSSPSNPEAVLRLNFAIDAAKRAAAKEIIPILPYYPYARQDKKDQPRGPIAGKVIAEMLEHRGSTGVILFDLHADQIQGFFNIPVTHLEGKNVFSPYIESIYDADTILCGPDAGSSKRVERMKKQMLKYHNIDIDFVMMHKSREKANEIETMYVIGDVEGKNVIILDDIVDTAGTLCKAAEVLIDNGAKSVRAIISHPVLSGLAYERIGQSKFTELVVSDSLGSEPNSKIKVISVARQIALAVSAINNKSSYEGLKEERW